MVIGYVFSRNNCNNMPILTNSKSQSHNFDKKVYNLLKSYVLGDD